MEKELDLDVIKSTQTLLGKYVKRPPLSEKLLKKPPFRFLHDIITTVLKTTGFFEDLFEEDELVSENVKDRDSKIQFLSKVISVISLTTGKTLSVKPSKIVAGQEPDRTNELLQCLAQALDKKLSSKEAVAKYKANSRLPKTTDTKTNEPNKSVKKSTETKKLTSKSSEKLTSNAQKKEPREQSTTRKEKEKINDSKLKKKENGSIKNEPHNKNTQHKTVTKKIPGENKQHNETQQFKASKNTTPSNLDKEQSQNAEVQNKKTGEHEDKYLSKDRQDTTSNTELSTHRKEHNELEQLNSSYTIAENDFNSSLSSQDLMEVEKPKLNNITSVADVAKETISINEQTTDEIKSNDNYFNESENVDTLNENQKSGTLGSGNSKLENSKKPINNDSIEKTVNNMPTTVRNNSNIARPASVRPSSSRPGAPRPREKLDNFISESDNLLLGKVNIIAEQAQNEEEEETSIIIVEQKEDTSSIVHDQQEQLQLSSNEHGHLVQQILDSQKKFSQVTGKTEIEWQFGAQKAKEAQYQEIEQLRFNIQALSRTANPLGKLLDHIQEDVEVMRQELQQWTNIYDEVSKEMLIQKTINEDSLLPLHSKLKQFEEELEEKRDKINDLKILIHKNSSRIEKLLASGNVQ